MAARPARGPRASQLAKGTPRYRAEVSGLGSRVRALRTARGWTLEKAAEAMNLDLKHLQKVEAGVLNVTMVTLVRIAEGFGEPMSELFKAPKGKR